MTASAARGRVPENGGLPESGGSSVKSPSETAFTILPESRYSGEGLTEQGGRQPTCCCTETTESAYFVTEKNSS
jgi:hypothetical protein